MIRFLKGYARKSVLLEELYRGCPAKVDNKLIIDLVGYMAFLAGEAHMIKIEKIESPEEMEVLLENISKRFPECVSLFVYSNFPDSWIQDLLHISEKYARYFDILYTIQIDESMKGSFEIVEHRYSVV